MNILLGRMKHPFKHPLEKFRFCPVCGSAHFVVNNFKSKKCEDCGFTYYANPCSATAAFIINRVQTTGIQLKRANSKKKKQKKKPLSKTHAHTFVDCFCSIYPCCSLRHMYVFLSIL